MAGESAWLIKNRTDSVQTMPATHEIDAQNKLILTRWKDEPTVSDLIDALVSYQAKIKNKPEYADYNEIVDFSGVDGLKLDAVGLKRVVELAAGFDKSTSRCKCAIVVSSSLAFGLARMYAIARSMNSKTTKVLEVFKDIAEAYMWLGVAPPGD